MAKEWHEKPASGCSQQPTHTPKKEHHRILWTADEEDILAVIGLWFEDKVLKEYDGLGVIPTQALDLCDKMGYDTSYMRELLED